LITNGAKINGKTDDDGYTPLDLAIKNKREKKLKIYCGNTVTKRV
tara:strand:+ start:122 stop:256 length:135 start_codon:yes stop_codon:yes gene_type:complete